MTQEQPQGRRYKPRRATRRPSRLPILIALAVVAVAVIIALFFLGFAIPGWAGAGAAPTPTPTLTPTPTPTPTVTAPPAGPVAPGSYAWDELGGGECISGYTSPWAEKFTVVSCTAPHDAQLLRRGQLAGIIGAPYPGEAAIAEQMTLLCTDPAVLDLTEAGKYTWMQWQAAYPPDADRWNDGDRSYFCFFNRSSGEKLTNSIVKAK